MKYICNKCGKPTDNVHAIEGTEHTYSLCDDCIDRLNREYDYQSEGEQINERHLACPHCGHEYEDYDAYGFDEGNTEEVKCDACGKKFDLEIECIRRYSAKRSICEMPEDYGND